MNSNHSTSTGRLLAALTMAVALTVLLIAGRVVLGAIGDTASEFEQLREGAAQHLTAAGA